VRPITVFALAALAALAAVAACSITACSSDPGSDSGSSPTLHPLLRTIETFALGLGVDADDPGAQLRLAQHDLIVVDGQSTSAPAVAALRADGAIVLAYLSVGTIEPYRPWFDEARESGWLLDQWDDWDEWYADVDAVGLRRLLRGEAAVELARGFDGLFLDNVDMVESHPDQAEGMRTLVAELDELVGPDRVLFSQNGDPKRQGITDRLDGWNREDVSFTYDFDADGYLPIDEDDRERAAEQLRAVRADGVLVTTTDYVPEVDPALWDEAVAVSCDAGAVPFVSDIDLTRLPEIPFRCA